MIAKNDDLRFHSHVHRGSSSGTNGNSASSSPVHASSSGSVPAMHETHSAHSSDCIMSVHSPILWRMIYTRNASGQREVLERRCLDKQEARFIPVPMKTSVKRNPITPK